jgi:hypothetical protein
MNINGFTENEVTALVDSWNLGTPIDVLAFLERRDVPEDAKRRVEHVAGLDKISSGAPDAELAKLWRQAQAQIILEVSRLVLPSE